MVAVTAPGAMEFKPAFVATETDHRDVPPELGVASRDSPRHPPGVVPWAGPLVLFVVFPDVEAVGKRARLGWVLCPAEPQGACTFILSVPFVYWHDLISSKVSGGACANVDHLWGSRSGGSRPPRPS